MNTQHRILAETVSPQSVRALHNHVVSRGPEPLREWLAYVSEALRYGHNLTLTIGDPEVDSDDIRICPDPTEHAHGAPRRVKS